MRSGLLKEALIRFAKSAAVWEGKMLPRGPGSLQAWHWLTLGSLAKTLGSSFFRLVTVEDILKEVILRVPTDSGYHPTRKKLCKFQQS